MLCTSKIFYLFAPLNFKTMFGIFDRSVVQNNKTKRTKHYVENLENYIYNELKKNN